jgi:hypothetical protein
MNFASGFESNDQAIAKRQRINRFMRKNVPKWASNPRGTVADPAAARRIV